ncbi:MAG: phage tail assembly protein [Hyphomicrobiales bacterium]
MTKVKLKTPIEVQRNGALVPVSEIQVNEPKVAFIRKSPMPYRTIVEQEKGKKRVEVINDPEALFEWCKHLTELSTSELESMAFADYKSLTEAVQGKIGPLA